MAHHIVTKDIGGRELTIETGIFARQADGAVTVRYGETVVLATAVMAKEPRENVDFLPLYVDYEEKLYAAGKIKGSRFIKREGRPSDDSILRGRLVDRAIRPLFPEYLNCEIQVIVNVLSYDTENDAAVLGLIAASAALSISDIPFAGPVSAVRVGKKDGELILNPTATALAESTMDIVVAVFEGNVIMLEAEAKEVPEEEVDEAIQFAKEHAATVSELIDEFRAKAGCEKRHIEEPTTSEELASAVNTPDVRSKVEAVLYGDVSPTSIRKHLVYDIGNELASELEERFPDQKKAIIATFMHMVEGLVYENVLEKKRRVGGRALDEIRPLEMKVGVLPRPHGTGYFMRGETQVLTIATLGAPGDEQIIDGLEEEYKKQFMHHYNFPPFSVGEIKPLRGPSRRDIGHGALAEKALKPVVPKKEDFPYTIRLVSEVFGSNGSSSMASTCGSSLALMDAGVPIKAPVAGIAMGMASNDKGEYSILTDIQDLEDVKGGMDFKITGTSAGITAIQMDTKTHGISMEMTRDTLTQGKRARLELLEAMAGILAEPRKELSKYAPRIHTMQIDTEKIREVIGPGGKTINGIIDATGVEIDIEQTGLVFITSETPEGMAKAIEMVEHIVKEPEPGEEYSGKVTRVENFGAFVELWPGKEGLVHVSQIAQQRIEDVASVLKIGQEVNVKVTEIDALGRINLSMKEIEQKTPLVIPEQRRAPERRPRSDGDRDRRSHGPRRPR